MKSRGSAEDMRRLRIGLSTLAVIISLVYISHVFRQQLTQGDSQDGNATQDVASLGAAISSE